MEENPAAAGEAQAPQTEQISTEPAQSVDMHGFTSEQLADIDKFFKANGGFESIKSKISNPQQAAPTQPAKEPEAKEQPAEPVQQAVYTPPKGAITQQEYLTKRYFLDLSNEERYSGISAEIASGQVLNEMTKFGMKPFNPDGSINDDIIHDFLDLKAKTVPAKATSAEPNASAAPTVEYVAVGDKIADLNQAYSVISQDMQLRRQGQPGHPRVADAEAFIKESMSGNKK